uniref:Uncharacterized protein n=1 Tax=Anguilla anguilla TaxID=7936 RepID=A0A0E9WN25_ANGAN
MVKRNDRYRFQIYACLLDRGKLMQFWRKTLFHGIVERINVYLIHK